MATYPNEHTIPMFLVWHREHALGRKRLLDTLLGATYLSNQVRSLVTTNARDFRIFDKFSILQP